MANEFDPSNYDVAQPAPSIQAPPVQSGFDSSAYDIQDALPKYIDGSDHNKAINESPLDFTQRLQLSAGQVGGSMTGTVKKLQEWGYEVKKNKQDDLVIKDPKDGLWKQYDAKDAWDSSRSVMADIKEAGKDIADVIPGFIAGAAQTAVTGSIATAAAAGTVASGGTATVPALAMAAFGHAAGAAAGTALMTTMGKLAGTYKPESDAQELSDLAHETLFNFGGAVIAAGVRPTVGVIGKALGKVGEAFGGLDDATKNGVAATFGTMTGKDPGKIAYILEKDGAKAVEGVFDSLRNEGVKSSGAMTESLINRQIDSAAKIATMAQPILSKVYDVETKKVLDAVEAFGKGQLQQAPGLVGADQIIQSAVKLDGETIARGGLAELNPFLNFAKKDGTLLAHAGEAMDLGLSNVNIVPKTAAQLAKDFPELALTDESRAFIQKAANAVTQFADVKKSGKDAAEWAMKANRGLKNVLNDLRSQAIESAPSLSPVFRNITNAVDAGIKGPLDKMSGGAYTNYLEQYAKAATALEPWTSALDASMGANMRRKAYETVVTQLNSRAGANVTRKGGMDAIQQLAAQYAPEVTTTLNKHLSSMELHAVSQAFTELVNPGLRGVASASTVATGLTMMNPMTMAGGAMGAIASSPRAALKLAPAAMQAARAMKAMATAGGTKIVQGAKLDPRVLQQLITMPLHAQAQSEQIHQDVGNMLQQAVGAPTAVQGVNFQNPAKMQAEQMKQQQQQGR